MVISLPTSAQEFMNWPWEKIKPYYHELDERALDEANVEVWLSQWSYLIDLISETYARLTLAVNLDTTDKGAEYRYNAFLDGIYPASQAADQKLKEKLLASELEPNGFKIPLRKMRAESAIFSEVNLPLLSKERKLASQYNKVIGAQTVLWEGEERTLTRMRAIYQNPDRQVRQRAWQLCAQRQLADREAINRLWRKLLQLRSQLAENASLPGYRAYRWQQLLRLDYTPDDCVQFRQAIEQVAVPAASRVYDKHRCRAGLDSLRPWDLDLDLYPIHLPPLPSYGGVENLQETAEAVFKRVDPVLGKYFHSMRTEGLLDLENRKGKAPGGYCTAFPVTRRPLIFMNAVGLPGDVRTLLHEAGHAFHNFERLALPYAQQRHPGLEFAEVASMSMELLASPYLAARRGGFYSDIDAAQASIQHLEHILIFWPYMAVVDAFQHWAYQNTESASDPANCDAKWLELWQRFLPGVDWYGLEVEAMTGWHRKQHIYRYPFYYVEYGLAQLGAVQVWRNALEDQPGAVAVYRKALSLGGTETLPELFAAAGAKLAFDSQSLREAIQLIEGNIEKLEAVV